MQRTLKKLHILELCDYSAGICGVWQRVKQEAELLSKKNKVKVFSSNATKGSEKIAKSEDKFGKIEIKRFPFKKLGGESFMVWNFEEEAFKFNPNIFIAHSYRHPHTTKALKIAKKINARVFLVTHAPFVEKNSTRSFFEKLAVNFYDLFIALRTLNKFDKIIAITRWEIPYLLNLGVKKNKIVYIPNGIPEEFFKTPFLKEQNKILFLGRISPIKNLEVLIKALSLIQKKDFLLEIVGPTEKDYLKRLICLIKGLNLSKKVKFTKPIFDLKEKIKKIDSCSVFVLPSKREAMPQSLIEAMARKKVVIASSNKGTREIIEDNKNGYLFQNNNSRDLADKLDFVLSRKQDFLKNQAKKSTEQFKWPKIIKKLESLF